jgi:two-component system, NarL family, sensor histidine kinase DesK
VRTWRRRLGRVGGLLWTVVWLFPLVSPLTKARTTADVIGLIAFAVGYTLVSWSAYEWPAPGSIRLAGLGLVTVLGFALAATHGPEWLILPLFVAAAGVAVFGAEPDPGRSVAVLLVCEVAIVGIGLAHGVDVATILIYAMGTFLSSALVFTVRRMGRLIVELRSTREALAATAVAEERLRFARDLHDLLGHTLSLVVVKAEAVRRLAERDPAAAAVHARDIEAVGRQALTEVREAVTGYRDGDLRAEVARAKVTLKAAGVTTTVRDDGSAVPPRAASALSWVVREGVTNVVRHSGAAHCEIIIATAPGQTTVEVRDDGTAAVDPAFGNGLRGLSERLGRAGGTLTARSVGRGFLLAGTVPGDELLA